MVTRGELNPLRLRLCNGKDGDWITYDIIRMSWSEVTEAGYFLTGSSQDVPDIFSIYPDIFFINLFTYCSSINVSPSQFETVYLPKDFQSARKLKVLHQFADLS